MGALGVWTGARGWSAGREAGSSAVTAGGAPEGHAGPPAYGTPLTVSSTRRGAAGAVFSLGTVPAAGRPLTKPCNCNAPEMAAPMRNLSASSMNWRQKAQSGAREAVGSAGRPPGLAFGADACDA